MIGRTAISLLLLSLLPAAGPTDDKNVEVYETKAGNSIVLSSRLANLTEATITVDAKFDNVKPSVPLPATFDSAGRTQFTLVTFASEDRTRPWNCKWSCTFKPGGRAAGKPQPYSYSLPFKTGPFRVIQGPHGLLSHGPGTGDEEAWDWAMPAGTEVYPARPGTVAGFRQDCSRGGPDPALRPDYNYVLIKHEDGTFAEYAHLRQNGVLVALGDKVTLDKPIALSGNTGFTNQPHLHLVVFNNETGAVRKSIPIEFKAGRLRVGGRIRTHLKNMRIRSRDRHSRMPLAGIQ